MARRRSSGITSLGFNQDQGCFTCCLTSGLRVYNVEPLVEKAHYSKEELGEVSLCEMVYRTNWLLVVKARKPCSLMLLDDQQRAFRAEVLFKSPIRGLRARRDKVAVVLSSSIQVLSLPSLQRIALVRTPSNARPLCALATEPNVALLAAPAHRRGSLQLLDVSRAVKGAQSSSPAVLGCHQSELVCLGLSANGAKLATASARGTIIRLWDTASKQILHELRRGSDYANVYCIKFNPTGTLVCCVSDKGTLHVWAARGGYAHLAAAHAAPDTRALCAFAGDDQAVVICEDGTFHKFTFSAEGNCHRSEFEYFMQDVSRAVKGAQSSSPAVLGCHQSELVCLGLSANGAKLATASARGTIIRLWDTASKQILHELRRGSDYANVYCIKFNPTGTLVCCVSDKGTLHVWAARGGYAHLAAAHAAPDTRALCAFAGDDQAVVICEDGTFHKFTFSAEGNCHRSEFEYFMQVGDDDEFLQ